MVGGGDRRRTTDGADDRRAARYEACANGRTKQILKTVFRADRGFKTVGPFVVMIYRMVMGDLLRFVSIYMVFVMGFSQGEWVRVPGAHYGKTIVVVIIIIGHLFVRVRTGYGPGTRRRHHVSTTAIPCDKQHARYARSTWDTIAPGNRCVTWWYTETRKTTAWLFRLTFRGTLTARFLRETSENTSMRKLLLVAKTKWINVNNYVNREQNYTFITVFHLKS